MSERGVTTLLRHPAAWLPMLLSVVALALVAGYVARFGVVQHQDEGTAAWMFQLLMAADALAIALFGLRWLPVAPRPALAVLALQIVLAVVPIASVVLLEA